jgi:hypothetical protein
MNVKLLREALNEIADRLSPAIVASLEDALRPLDGLTVDELCAQLAKIKIPKRKTGVTTDQAVVSRYLDELKSSQKDAAGFKSILERVKADRAVKVREANLLALGFLGNEREYKTKPLALKAIAARQFDDERIASRKEKVSDIF